VPPQLLAHVAAQQSMVPCKIGNVLTPLTNKPKHISPAARLLQPPTRQTAPGAKNGLRFVRSSNFKFCLPIRRCFFRLWVVSTLWTEHNAVCRHRMHASHPVAEHMLYATYCIVIGHRFPQNLGSHRCRMRTLCRCRVPLPCDVPTMYVANIGCNLVRCQRSAS
jgi:hypothetical protein